jgi:hypothetical protein
MRYGLHSGPVTAGVLRGEKSRFQLFGDTVNFASRMESTGQGNKIQCSQATADLLISGGKRNWVHRRDDLVDVKGKGMLQTFFIIIQRETNEKSGSADALRKDISHISLKCKLGGGRSSHASQSNHDSVLRRSVQSDHSRQRLLTSHHQSQIWTQDTELDIEDDYDGFEDTNNQERLVEWNVEILSGLIRRIVACRRTSSRVGSAAVQDEAFVFSYSEGKNALDEITEIIPIGCQSGVPDFGASCYFDVDPDTIILPVDVEIQLRVSIDDCSGCSETINSSDNIFLCCLS